MSDTPKAADDCMKLLDNGWAIRLFRNQLGSYTAVAKNDSPDHKPRYVETDDFIPSQALYRLVEKVFGRIA